MAALGFKHRAKRRHTEPGTNHHQGGQPLHHEGLSSHPRLNLMGTLVYGQLLRLYPIGVHPAVSVLHHSEFPPNASIGQHQRFIYGVVFPVLIQQHMKPLPMKARS